MTRLSRLIKELRKIHRLSKIAVALGATMMTFFYIISAITLIAAPYSADYFYTVSVHRAALEAAPASLAVGVCAGLLGDLMLRRHSGGDSH